KGKQGRHHHGQGRARLLRRVPESHQRHFQGFHGQVRGQRRSAHGHHHGRRSLPRHRNRHAPQGRLQRHRRKVSTIFFFSRSPGVRYSEPLGFFLRDPRGSEYLTPGLAL